MGADLNEMVAAKKREISDQLENLAVVEGLSLRQREALAQIVMKLVGGYELSRTFPQSKKAFRAEQRFGLRQRRMFSTKIGNALAAIDDALKYAVRVSDGSQPNELFARTLKALAVPALHRAKKSLESIPLDWENFTTPKDGQGFEDPKREARIALMEFFVNECGHTKSDASVRTGKIGNALLGWNVDLADQSESANPKRARAVLKSVQRSGTPRRMKRR